MSIICSTFSFHTCMRRERTNSKGALRLETVRIDCGLRLSFARHVWAAYLVEPMQSIQLSLEMLRG